MTQRIGFGATITIGGLTLPVNDWPRIQLTDAEREILRAEVAAHRFGAAAGQRTLVAAERMYPGEAIFIGPDGRAYLTDRTEAARRGAVEDAIARHLPDDDDDDLPQPLIGRRP